MINLSRYETFLLDLDGTLIDVNPQVYLTHYIDLAYKYFHDLDLSLHEFGEKLLLGTKLMLANTDENKTPLQVFKEEFAKMMRLSEKEVWKRFSAFYEGAYNELKAYIQPFPKMPQAIQHLKQHGKTLILATNPVFPYNAVEKRILWGGLDPKWFQLITHAENSIWCKPNPRYYQKILQDARVPSETAIMIGNDLMNDVSAKKLGITTVLLKDHETKGEFSELGRVLEPDYSMSVKEFSETVLAQFP